ncbi:MAG TPA: Hpt domain-containing protein [Ferruginibacter sp.]|nr:Hpt domain-containing protein [Ferruginibacter sp.]
MKNPEKYSLAETPEGLYDLSMLEDMDDNEYLLEVLTIWLMESPKDIADMKEALEAGKTDVVCKKAHKFKSSAGVIQAEHLRAMLENIEKLGKSGAPAGEISCLVENVNREYTIIEKSLKKYMEGLT